MRNRTGVRLQAGRRRLGPGHHRLTRRPAGCPGSTAGRAAWREGRDLSRRPDRSRWAVRAGAGDRRGRARPAGEQRRIRGVAAQAGFLRPDAADLLNRVDVACSRAGVPPGTGRFRSWRGRNSAHREIRRTSRI